jgi:hypothetical protein
LWQKGGAMETQEANKRRMSKVAIKVIFYTLAAFFLFGSYNNFSIDRIGPAINNFGLFLMTFLLPFFELEVAWRNKNQNLKHLLGEIRKNERAEKKVSLLAFILLIFSWVLIIVGLFV